MYVRCERRREEKRREERRREEKRGTTPPYIPPTGGDGSPLSPYFVDLLLRDVQEGPRASSGLREVSDYLRGSRWGSPWLCKGLWVGHPPDRARLKIQQRKVRSEKFQERTTSVELKSSPWPGLTVTTGGDRDDVNEPYPIPRQPGSKRAVFPLAKGGSQIDFSPAKGCNRFLRPLAMEGRSTANRRTPAKSQGIPQANPRGQPRVPPAGRQRYALRRQRNFSLSRGPGESQH